MKKRIRERLILVKNETMRKVGVALETLPYAGLGALIVLGSSAARGEIKIDTKLAKTIGLISTASALSGMAGETLISLSEHKTSIITRKKNGLSDDYNRLVETIDKANQDNSKEES